MSLLRDVLNVRVALGSMNEFKTYLTDLLAVAGIRINGMHKYDITIHSENIYNRILRDGEIGVGEGYMEGEWDCEQIDELVYRISKVDLEKKLIQSVNHNTPLVIESLAQKLKPHDSFEIGRKHYDIGNDLFTNMLDKRLVYSCGYWKKAKTLDQAQEDKLDLICRKLHLKRGMKVLDIGGGWGAFAVYAAQKYGVHVVNITVSKEQVSFANHRSQGLPVENRLVDYHEVNDGPYDRIVSVGMFEHVGSARYTDYFDMVRRNLKTDGLFLLHTIGASADYEKSGLTWMGKYIFPNSELPSLVKISRAIDKKFILEDLHNFGYYYEKTLMHWHANFNKNWSKIKDTYGEKFHRMWNYYLLTCAGMFRSRKLQLWQLVLSKQGVEGGYEGVR